MSAEKLTIRSPEIRDAIARGDSEYIHRVMREGRYQPLEGSRFVAVTDEPAAAEVSS